MRRRELLEATGLAAVADLEAIAERADGTDADDRADGRVDGEGASAGGSTALADTQRSALLARLPAPSEAPDDRYDATLARRLDPEVLQAPDLLGDADAHASVVSRRATATVAVGVPDAGEAVETLERRGFRRSGSVDGRPVFVDRGRYRQRVAAVATGESAVVLGRGASLDPVASLVRAVARERSTPVDRRLPDLAAALDDLGPGAVLALSPAGRRESEDPRPAATGSRLALRAPGGRLRTVAVYDSPRDARVAAAAADADSRGAVGPDADDLRIDRDGRTVLADRSVPATDLPIDR